MKYDITKHSSPKLPHLGKGTECVKLLLSLTSKEMHEPLVPMLFPVLGAYISGAEFRHPTSFGRHLWPTWWPKVGISRANCPLL